MHLELDGKRYPLSNDMADYAWDKEIPVCPNCGETLTFPDTFVHSHWHDDFTIECLCGWEGRLQ